MEPRCTVCTHEDCQEIDEALAAGTACAALHRTYGLSSDALARHKARHLPTKLVKAREAADVLDADHLLQQTRDLQEHALDVLKLATECETPNLRAANGAVRELRGILELMGKLLGILTPGGGVAVGVSVNDTVVQVTYEEDAQERRELLNWLSFEEVKELRTISTSGETIMARAVQRRDAGERPPGYIDAVRR